MAKAQNPTTKSSQRRRPGRDPFETKAMSQEGAPVHHQTLEKKDQEMDQVQQAQNQGSQQAQVPPQQNQPDTEKSWDQVEAEAAQAEQEQPEIYHLEFYGSELVRLKAPKLMEVAEKVAFDWVNDKDFENIQVGHPVAQIALAQGLKTAKKVEKKLEEKGVIAMAKMGYEFAKSKLKK